jgi:hypothetical protein
MNRSRLTGSLKALFGTIKKPKKNVTIEFHHKDAYYKHYYFPETICWGIDEVARLEHTSKRRAALILMAAGISKYFGARVAKSIDLREAARADHKRWRRDPAVRFLINLAKEKGADISEFF